MEARLIFYYGFSIRDVETMTLKKLQQFIVSLDMILARDQMAALNAAGFPNMKDGPRKKYYKDVDTQRNSGLGKTKKTKSTKELYHDLIRKFSLGG